ncbi:MAG: hypothetical protein HC831_05325 [Chloroflexia bacterium]|nr:hypothetical protein [Bacteroidales bacterium]NJO88441.1 hypothetical protein [Chloroflexia bacterium]
MQRTDALIIGAGPAGCMAAFVLADYFNVTLIELKPIPRRKSCSGILIKKHLSW